MRIGLLCAAERGRRVLEHLVTRRPDLELRVVSFREAPVEPPFLDAIRSLAESAGAPFLETRRFDAAAWDRLVGEQELDLLLAVGWRYLIPEAVCARPRRGTWVFHDSLLPRYRGFAPTVWSIVNGEPETGITLFRAAPLVDSGPVADREAVPIGEGDTVAVVMERITGACLAILDRRLEALLDGTVVTEVQDEAAATWTCRRLPEDDEIRWDRSTRRIHDLVRAVTRPYPGAWTWHEGRRLRVWAARGLEPGPRYVGRVPGRVVACRPGEGVVVLTGDGALLLTEVQPEDGPPVAAEALLGSTRITLGRASEPAP